MKKLLIILFTISTYLTAHSCSFDIIPFCNTINEAHPDNVILRGYFSSEIENGLIFTRLETLRGDEDRSEIKVWDNTPFDCNGIITRTASLMGAIDQEIIISINKVDSVIFGEEVLIDDYRVPTDFWWQTHNLHVEDGYVHGYYSYSQGWGSNGVSILYEDFIERVIEDDQCLITNTNDSVLDEDDIKIYPTVTSDYIYMEYKESLVQSDVKIFDSSGRELITTSLKPTIDLGMLTKGLYIVMIRTRENRTYHERIIKL